MKTPEQLESIDVEDLEAVHGGKGGVMDMVRVGLVGLSLGSGNVDLLPPEVNPIRIEQPYNIGIQPKPPVKQR